MSIGSGALFSLTANAIPATWASSKWRRFYPSGGGRQCVGVDAESSLGRAFIPLSSDIGHRFTGA
jgi:hypothetical protein